MKSYMKIKPLGDRAVIIQLGDSISAQTHIQVKKCLQLLEASTYKWIVEVVPSYTNVSVYYNPFDVYQKISNEPHKNKTIYHFICEQLEQLFINMGEQETIQGKTIEIPVVYGGSYGPDLAYVAAYHQLSEEEVIRIHTSQSYLVHMLGFAPGFPFLGGMSEKIATPRKEEPRLTIPAGSVGIAGGQTGVYPIATPGGWQLIGRTPTALFLPEAENISPISIGDQVKFHAISEEDYQQLVGEKR